MLKEGQFPLSLAMSFSPYLGVFKVVMVADCVCLTDQAVVHRMGNG